MAYIIINIYVYIYIYSVYIYIYIFQDVENLGGAIKKMVEWWLQNMLGFGHLPNGESQPPTRSNYVNHDHSVQLTAESIFYRLSWCGLAQASARLSGQTNGSHLSR